MINIIKLREDTFSVDKEAEVTAMQSLIESITYAKNSMTEFLRSISVLPRMSKELNKARKKAEDNLVLLISKLEFSRNISQELLNKIND